MADTSQSLAAIVEHSPLELAISAWLHKHGKREGEHTRTSKAYEETIGQFRAGLQRQGLDLDSDPGRVALNAQAFAYGSTRGRQVKPTTANLRLAILSSFYVYAKKLKLLDENPIDLLDREKVQEYAGAQALDASDVATRLQGIDQSTLKGARDYAILSALLYTGRRAQEVATLEWQHVSMHNGKARLTFEHAKGDEVMQDDLPAPVTHALLRWLHKWYGAHLGNLEPESPLWVSLAHDVSHGQPLGYQSINALCKQHLGTSKVHATRHTAAHSMEKVGLTVSEIQSRLGHKSLATTGRYLASLRRAENRKADELAALYGIE
jgi:integrase/recombinase XerC